MKKLVTVIALLLSLVSVSASADNKDVFSQTNYNGYLVSVKDTGGALEVQVRSQQPYGVSLQSSRKSSSASLQENKRHIRLVFDIAPEVSLQQTVKASDVYSVKMAKKSLDTLYLSIKTGTMDTLVEQPIWTRAVQQ